MPNITSIGVTSGIGSSGTGTVSTIDAMFTAAGTPSATNVQTVQTSTNNFNVVISSGTIASISSGTVIVTSLAGGTITTVQTVTSLTSGSVSIFNGANTVAVKAAQVSPSSNDAALVVAISPNSGLALGSVVVSSVQGGTITSLTSGSVSIISGANTAAVKAANTAPSTTDPALVVALSPNSALSLGTVAVSSITGGTITSLTSGSVAITQGSNTMAVKASVTAPSSTDPSAVVGLSPNSVDFGTGTGGSHTLRMLVDTSQLSSLLTTAQPMATGYQLVATPTDSVVTSGGKTVTIASSVTISPSTAVAYAVGNLVANSTTAASILAVQFTTLGRVTSGSGVIVGAALQKTSTATSSAAFRIHYFETAPVFASGAADHVSIATGVQASGKGYIGYVDIPAMTGFSDSCWGTGAPDNTRGSIPYVCSGSTTTVYALIEARGTYTPVSTTEVFTAYTMALQD